MDECETCGRQHSNDYCLCESCEEKEKKWYKEQEQADKKMMEGHMFSPEQLESFKEYKRLTMMKKFFDNEEAE